MPVGTVTMRVQALTAPGFDPGDFAIDEITDDVTHVSATEIEFTR
jgi:hypothetical protein